MRDSVIFLLLRRGSHLRKDGQCNLPGAFVNGHNELTRPLIWIDTRVTYIRDIPPAKSHKVAALIRSRDDWLSIKPSSAKVWSRAHISWRKSFDLSDMSGSMTCRYDRLGWASARDRTKWENWGIGLPSPSLLESVEWWMVSNYSAMIIS